MQETSAPQVSTNMFFTGTRHMPYTAMIFVQCVYAALALLSKAAMSHGMSPFVFVVYRLSLAFLVLSPPAFFLERFLAHLFFVVGGGFLDVLALIYSVGRRKGSVPLTFSLLCKIFLVSFCGLTLSLNLYCIAIEYTSATFAAASTNLIPAITFTIALLLRLESVRNVGGAAKVMGSLVGVLGAFVYAFVKGPSLSLVKSEGHQGGDSSSSHSQQWIKGWLIMISANMLWSLWLILQGQLIKEYPSKMRLTALQCLFGSIQSACWAIAMEKNPSAWMLHWDIRLISVVYCGVVVTGLTYCIQVWVIEKKGPVFTSVFTPLAMIVTAVSSALLWKESLYLGSVGGAILMVGGLYLVLWGKSQEEDGDVFPLPNTKDGMIGGHPAVASSV